MIQSIIIRINYLLVYIFLVSCTGTLPGYLLPTSVKDVSIDHTDVIRYRQLTVEDFKSTNPREIKSEYKHFSALSTIYINFDQDKLDRYGKIKHTNNGDYVITISRPGYHAFFDQRMSWWNSNDDSLTKDYVIQHEQIHFALMELEARRMNNKRQQNPIIVEGKTLDEAIKMTADAIQSDLVAIDKQALVQHKKFDIQTSGRYLPKTQSNWMKMIREDFYKLLRR